jgi:hypothetical protein
MRSATFRDHRVSGAGILVRHVERDRLCCRYLDDNYFGYPMKTAEGFAPCGFMSIDVFHDLSDLR